MSLVANIFYNSNIVITRTDKATMSYKFERKADLQQRRHLRASLAKYLKLFFYT